MIEDLTKLVLEWQEKHRLTDSQLADLLGISASLVSYLRSGQRHLGIDTVRAIYAKIAELRNECFIWVLPGIDLRTLKQLEDLKAMRH